MFSKEEISLLNRLSAGEFDGLIGDVWSSGKSTCWREIKEGTPVEYKQGPGGKSFDNRENERYEGVMHLIQKWESEEEKLQFLRKYGWLMKDNAVVEYSAKFKPQKR